ncbi:unnamed protein product [Ilex paraguariensis]|uniref:non-specific serine/threonine protein kinase n=1 Tax=Ilex paraguariensis TaxID=185542 RepID=A0ABC8RCJ0_9AQUA
MRIVGTLVYSHVTIIELLNKVEDQLTGSDVRYFLISSDHLSGYLAIHPPVSLSLSHTHRRTQKSFDLCCLVQPSLVLRSRSSRPSSPPRSTYNPISPRHSRTTLRSYLRLFRFLWGSLSIVVNFVATERWERMKRATKKVGKYEVGRTVGEGTFAKVKFAQNTETGESVAVKVMAKSTILKHKMVNQVQSKHRIYT